MNISEIILDALKREGRKQIWLVTKLNEYRHLLNKEDEYSSSLVSYKLKNNSFTVEEFLIIASVLELDVNCLKENFLKRAEEIEKKIEK